MQVAEVQPSTCSRFSYMPRYLSVCPTKQVFLYGFFVSTNRVLPVLRNYIQHRLNRQGAVYQVEHSVHLARIGEHLAMVSHSLAAFDLFCVFVVRHKKSWNFAYASLGVPRPA